MKGVGKVKGNREETASSRRLAEINCSPPDLEGQTEGAVTKWWKELQLQAEARPLTGTLVALLRGIQPVLQGRQGTIFQPCILGFSPHAFHRLLQGKPESKGAWGMLTIEANLLGHRAFQRNESWRHRIPAQALRRVLFLFFFFIPPLPHFPIQSHKISLRIFNV